MLLVIGYQINGLGRYGEWRGWHTHFKKLSIRIVLRIYLRTPHTPRSILMPGGNMHRAEFAAGDVLTSAGGKTVDSIEAMQDILRSHIPGTIVKCTYVRGDASGEKYVYLAPRPDNPGYEIYKSDLISGSFVPIFGMKLASSSTVNHRSYTVVDVLKGGIADESGFSENDPVSVSRILPFLFAFPSIL